MTGRVAHLPGGVHGLVRAMLDAMGGRARFRLSSPVVSVRNDGPPETATTATVGYFDGHEVRSVGAGAVILACWHSVVPYLVPDLPGAQRTALRAAVKTPLVEAVVRLRSADAWRRLGVSRTRWTGAYWCMSELTHHSGDGVTARLVAAPSRSELGPAEGAAAGRQALLRTPYAMLEFGARDQLARLLGAERVRSGQGRRGGGGLPVGSWVLARILPSVARVPSRRAVAGRGGAQAVRPDRAGRIGRGSLCQGGRRRHRRSSGRRGALRVRRSGNTLVSYSVPSWGPLR
ncbi:hypothetical protein ACFSTC_56200 [Nonomuraea ferruginea]